MSIFLTDTRKMKSLLFFLVLFGVIVIVWKFSSQLDGFQDIAPEAADPNLTIPLISPRRQTLTNGEVKPFTQPSAALLAPPPGQTASINALPAEDPALQKAKGGRLQNVYESMRGFYNSEAIGLQKLGDSSIQLPLATAKSDYARLIDELATLSKNPGLESSLTEDDLNGIEANLAYLQNKWRMSVNSGASPMPPTNEGFQSPAPGPGSAPDPGSIPPGSIPPGSLPPGSVLPGSAPGSVPPGSAPGSVTPGSAPGSVPPGSGSTPTTTTGGSNSITLSDLQMLITKIDLEIVRLQASGATDSNTQSRISVLTATRQRIEDLVSNIKSGVQSISTVPLTKSDINDFLKTVSNPTSPLKDILKDWGLSSLLSSLFPAYASGDLSGAKVARELFDKYAKDMTKNLSWDVSFNYKGKAEQDIAASYASAMSDARYIVDSTGQPVASNSSLIPNSSTGGGGSRGGGAGGYRGVFDSIITSMTGQKPASLHVGMGASGAGQASHAGGSSHEAAVFDWRTRSEQICKQINARGLNSYDYGCMKSTDTIKANFSWRGYSRMICTRLGTNYDPSIPELCGCPPPTWPGWRH